MINVEIISNEMIKPSSPTPHHLTTHKLSLLDQLAPAIYIPLIFFYQHDNSNPTIDHVKTSLSLKQSLSDILTIFYPLGGIVDQQSSIIDCNDSGAEFIEARAHSRLSNVIQEPSMEELKKFLPFEPLGHGKKIVLAVKTSFFDCGGVAIGVCISHLVADGTSLVEFMNAWAAKCRGEVESSNPSFDFVSFFPPRCLSELGLAPKGGVKTEKITTKRFVFDKEKLAEHKELAASCNGSSQVKDPTRVEVVSSLIWRCFMEVAKTKSNGPKRPFLAFHVANMRSRSSPPFKEHVFGNCWRTMVAFSESEDNCDHLVNKLRVAIRNINNDFVKQVQNGEYFRELKELKKWMVDLHTKGGVEQCAFTSWSRFPVYEVDFGWEKPAWVCTTTMHYKNLVVLMSSSCGKGIEVWVNMLEDDMKVFEEQYDKLLN